METAETGRRVIAMIDGGSVRFAIAADSDASRLASIWTGKTADYPTFIDALQHFLKLNDLHPKDHEFAIAVAGVARGDVVSVAHCRWYITLSGLRAFLRSEPLVLNELAATAWSLTALGQRQTIAIGPLPPPSIGRGKTLLVLGAGVGLGMATMHMTSEGKIVVLESEGGHCSFAAQDETDEFVLASLRNQHGHVSYERILSEPGLRNVYAVLAAKAGKPGTAADADLRTIARHSDDPLKADTLKLVVGALGSFLGSMTLAVSAWDGIILTGEFLRDLLPALQRGTFRERLEGKGRMSKLLRAVPVAFLDHRDISLVGAAAALAARKAAQPSPL